MLQNQYNTELRNELVAVIKAELCESTSSTMRKTYIYFLKAAVDTFSRVFIINNFLPSYIQLSKDKVSSVRMEWVSSLVVVKPFFDSEAALSNDLMTILNTLHFDPDQNVQEAA